MAVGRKADYTNHIAQLWSTDLYAQAENQTFWHNFEGPEGSSMPIIRVDDLEKGVGDTIKTDIVLALSGAGMTGDTALLEGNEEKLVLRQSSFTVDSLQHAVRWSKLGKILINHDMRTMALNQLSKWLSGKYDDRIFTEFLGSGQATLPTKNKWFGGTAGTRAAIADSDAGGRLTLDDITRIKAYFQTEIKGEPLKMANGEEWFGFVIHPYAGVSLKVNDAKWAQAQREAQQRGNDNPLFTGALGVWDGVILYESNRVPRSLNGGAPDIMVADNIFFGAQAMSRGYAYRPDWTEEYFSYGQEQGIATFSVFGQKLNVFDLNAVATTGDATDDTALGHMVVSTAAVGPTQP